MNKITALIIVDVQNDFCEEGALGIPGGSSIVPIINSLRHLYPFDYIFITQEWHYPDHLTFYTNHPGSKPFDIITLESGEEQRMYPINCLEGTRGAELHKDLIVEEGDMIIRKGIYRDIDTYSAFGTPPEDTGLRDHLLHKAVTSVYVCGLVYEYCVAATAIHAQSFGYDTYIISNATKEFSPETKLEMDKKMQEKGIKLITSEELFY